MQKQVLVQSERRKLRRLIGRALTGAALGAVFVALPAHANNYTVTTTTDSVAGSLRDAITSANLDSEIDTVVFDAGLGTDPTFTLNSALPSITNSSGVIFDTSNVGTVTLSEALTASNSGTICLNAGDGGNGVDGYSGNEVNGTNGSGSSISANIILNESGSLILNSGAGGNGGDGGYGGEVDGIDANGGAGGAGGNNSITGDVTATDSSIALISGAGGDGSYGNYGGYEGDGDANGGAGGSGGNSSITGDVTAIDSHFVLIAGTGGDGEAGGNGGIGSFGGGNANGGAGGHGGNSYIAGDVTATNSNFVLSGETGGDGGAGGTGGYARTGDANGGTGGLGGNSYIKGNVTANGSSIFVLTGSAGGNGGAGGSGGDGIDYGGIGDADGGTGGKGGNSYINGDVTGNDSSIFVLTGSAGGNGGAAGSGDENGTGNGGAGGAGGDSYIDGNVVATDSSRFILVGGSAGEAGVTQSTFALGGAGGAAGEAFITGDTTVNDRAEIDLHNGAHIDGSVSVTNGGYLYVGEGSYVGQDVTVDGEGRNNDDHLSEASLKDGSAILGNLAVTNGGWFGMENDDGMNVVNGGARFSNSATFWNYGQNILNANGDSTATTFDASSAFLPYLSIESYPYGVIDTDLLTVNNLVLNNTKLKPYWFFTGQIPVGETFDVIHYDGTLSGTFDPVVVSPLTFDVAYGSGYDGDVLLSVTGVDFTHMGGNENQRSLEKYLNHFYTIGSGYEQSTVITFDRDEELPFDLEQMVSNLSSAGDASPLDYLILDQYSAHNTQTYWNQQAFINSIADNLRNDSNMAGGVSSFALNQTNSGSTQMQLASLRQAMTAMSGVLGVSENSGGASNGVWAAYTGSHQHTDGDSGIGSNEWSSSSDGYTVGYTNGGDNFRWGVAAGHQKSTFMMVDSNNEIKGWNAGLYAAWKRKSVYLNGVLGYGNYDNSVYNESETDFKTHGLSAYLELGKRLKEESKGGLSPYASVLWMRVKNGSASDEYSGFNLESGSDNVYTTALGMRYNRRMLDSNGALKGGWQAGLAWLHQFGDSNFPVNGNYTFEEPYNFQIKGTGLSGNAAQVQFGAYGRIHGSLIGYANYVGTFGSKQNINGVSAGLGYQF